MTILSGVKLKLYPNKKQKQTIEQTFRNSRFVWNQFKNMQENRYNAMIDDYNSYKKQSKENRKKIINPIYIDTYGMQKMLTPLKKIILGFIHQMQLFYKKHYRILIKLIKTFLKNLINLKNQNSNHVNIAVNHLLVNHKNKNQEKQISVSQVIIMFM